MATSHIQQPTPYHAEQGAFSKGINRLMQKVGDIVLEQWANAVAGILGFVVLLALSVPFLSYLGLDALSKPIFFTLHYICAQIPSHSFYVFGHQLGLCERNLSIYSSMFIGSLIFALSKKRMPGIPWWIWVLMIIPIAWDGITQMFGLRESTWVLRVITGSLFGFGNVWFALPLMQKSLTETTPSPPARRALKPSPVPTK
jgi:uncharacterized membrane protein